jgi:excinuclease ABC subunit C
VKLGTKTRVMVSQIETITITIVESELEALLLESFYIKKYQPKYNIRLTDNKSYLRIRITIKDDYPKVLLTRQEEDSRSIYFGPFPSSSAVKVVLKIIRRIFPFQSVYNHPKRICLYHHLGLCPCPPMFDSFELKKIYKKNIKGIVRILEGESKIIMKELEKERDHYSKEEEYEKALAMQKKINALSLITTPFHGPFEYSINPNLREDIRQKELDGLMNALNANGFRLKSLKRIECYDISNIQGTNATGSMVVLTHGEIDKSQYRKFKIKRKWDKRIVKDLPNDFAMMKEVLQRRFNHEDWHFPDLIIVDGGKGQVSSALQALEACKVTIPLVGLAKREETIVVPHKSDSIIFNEISLLKNSPSLHLIQRIRDEAHRFAITYHRKLRSGAALVS